MFNFKKKNLYIINYYYTYFIINIYLFYNKLIIRLIILYTLISLLSISFEFINSFFIIVFELLYENSHTFCQDIDMADEQIINIIFNDTAGIVSSGTSSSNNSNRSSAIDLESIESESNSRDTYLNTYSFGVEERLKIDSNYFHHLVNCSTRFTINPTFFEQITENLILEHNLIQVNIERGLNFINVRNILRDNMFITASEYKIIFEEIQYNVFQLIKMAKYGNEPYIAFINNTQNNPFLLNLFNERFDPLIVRTIQSNLLGNSTNNISYFESLKNLTIFFYQTLNLLELNFQLFNTLEETTPNRYIDNNIGFDFTPSTHVVNTNIAETVNVNGLMRFYEPLPFINQEEEHNNIRNQIANNFSSQQIYNNGYFINN